MDSGHIIAFVEAVKDLFDTMLKMPVSVKKPHPKSTDRASYDVSGIITLTGTVNGTIILSFPTDLARSLITRFVGIEVTEDDPDFADAIGELVNIVAGGAKARFQDQKAVISCPSVVIGENHRVMHRRDAPIIVIPCECECGSFAVEVSLRREAAAAPKAANLANAG